MAEASRAGDSGTGLGGTTSSDDGSFPRKELLDSDRFRDLRPRLKPEELRLSMVPIRASVRSPVFEGEGDAARPGVAGGVAGGDAGEAMRIQVKLKWKGKKVSGGLLSDESQSRGYISPRLGLVA